MGDGYNLTMISKGGSGSSSSSSGSGSKAIEMMKPWSKRSKPSSSSSSSWISPLRQRQFSHDRPLVHPPCIWDVEFPRASPKNRSRNRYEQRQERVKLRRSLSLLERPTPPPPSCSSSVCRSLWSGESKQELQARLGVCLDAMPEETTSSSSSDDRLENLSCKQQEQQQQQQQDPSTPSDSSSIFSKHLVDSSSSSSRSDLSSSRATAREEQDDPQHGEGDASEYLDYTLVQGKLVPPSPITVAPDRDHASRRNGVDDSREESSSPSSPPLHLAMAPRNDREEEEEDGEDEDQQGMRYPARASSAYLSRSFKETTLGDGAPRIVARRLFAHSPDSRFSPNSRNPRKNEGSGERSALKNLLDALPRSLIRKRSGSSGGSDTRSICAAHLHYAIRHDHHSYTFVVDGSEELLVARAPRARGEDDDEVCSFFSWKKRRAKLRAAWRAAWASPPNRKEELVASLRLSTMAISDGRSELVLVQEKSSESDETDHHGARRSFSSWQSSGHSCACSSSIPVPSSAAAASAKKSKSLSHDSSPIRGKIGDEEDVDILRDVWRQMEMEADHQSQRRASKMKSRELAAFVVSESESVEGDRPATSVTVLVPVGEHGVPDRHSDLDGGDGGPSSLIERWRYGRCDCGGWDLGCALYVLERKGGDELLHISLEIQGGGGRNPSERERFDLVGVGNGLFAVRFQDPLSPLQAFATAVAILHKTALTAADSTLTAPVSGDQKALTTDAPWSNALPRIATDAHLERL